MSPLRRSKAAGLILLTLFLSAAAGPALLPTGMCPVGGAAFTPGGRDFMRLKNRDVTPGPGDFDEGVSLEALLRPGEDRGHADESENTAPGARGNWRATAWELHPVTAIEVLK